MGDSNILQLIPNTVSKILKRTEIISSLHANLRPDKAQNMQFRFDATQCVYSSLGLAFYRNNGPPQACGLKTSLPHEPRGSSCLLVGLYLLCPRTEYKDFYMKKASSVYLYLRKG